MRPTLSGPFRERVGFRELEYHCNGIVWAVFWDPNKGIDIGERSIYEGDPLERFYCISQLYIYMYIQ